MSDKEATARIKINKLLEAAGWRFFAVGDAPANVRLEPGVTIKSTDLDALGANFEKSSKGFVDFLLLDAKGFSLLVLEAKAEDKNPLIGKEQARKYAKSQNCRFVILSNGNLHYFWDLQRGNPYVITSFPTPDSVTGYQKVKPNPQRLIEEQVGTDYIVRTQRPNYATEAAWQNEAERAGYIQTNKLRFLRPYQLKAIHSLQAAVGDGKDRFLFEMATGTCKTLTAAAVIKLFLRSGNVSRVLFLVDRLELEDQAKKSFAAVLSADYQTVIYKENRDDWRRAEIVVTTVQSLLFNNKYQKLFSPTDFDLVISDEAHRSIGGNARAVFDYFIGYKLGLTATPRDYLRRFDGANPSTREPHEAERRLLLDTYRTFGCENSQPTFRYSLLDGVKEGFLVNPTVVDARTEVTTTLLSEEGFVVTFTDDAGEDQQQAFKQREFEKRFFADTTNQLLCKTFLENALRDPVSGEIGKSIIFAVSQNHAAKLAQILNQMADRMFPARYQSDFAVQVTSQITDAQQFTINFANNNLLGSGIHPNWPMVKLGNVVSYSSGGTPSKAVESYWIGDIPWVSAKDMKSDVLSDASTHVSETAVKESATQIAPVGSLLILVRGMGLANGVPICELAKPCAFNQDVKAMKPHASVNSTFLRVMLKQEEPQFRKILETAAHGTLKINTDDLSAISFPLPPLATQRAIVAEIEAEQALVAANRELIRRMEAKVKATIDRVWGSTSDSSTSDT
jgi:type I restriction enzyme R subunit